MHPRVLGSLTALILTACSTPTEPVPETEPKSEPKSEPNPAAVLVPLEDAPAVPGVEVLTPIGECPALTTLPADAPEAQRRLASTLAVARGLACQPELFGQSTPAILAALEAPEGLRIEVGRRSASITLLDPVEAGEVFAMLGVSVSDLRMVRTGRVGYVVVDASGDSPVVWPPSDLYVEFAPAIPQFGTSQGPNEWDFDPKRMINSLRIHLPESMLEFQHDEFAARALVEALKVLATVDDPNTLRKHALPSLGERYSIWEGLLGVEVTNRTSTIIMPLRTELAANDLAAVLDLPSPSHQPTRIHDIDVERLTSAGEAPFVWQGLSVDVHLRERLGTNADLAGWIVDSVTVARATPSE